MADKKEGFGLSTEQQPGRLATVYETPNYRVVVARLSDGPEGQPEELRLRYVVLSKRHPVICGHSGLEGEAIGLALSAEAMLVQAQEFAEDAKTRNFRAPEERPSGLGAPNFG
jgi:hypothetical protein